MPPASGVQAANERKIGLVPCLAFSVGTMIGGGVFTLSGIAVDEAGPAALVAYFVAGVVMLLSALSFVVISSRAKEGTSGYSPLGDILGPQWRFLTMWGFYLNGVICIAFVLVSFGSYLHQYFLNSFGPLAAAIVALGALVLLNLGPADLVGKAETYLVALKVSILVVFVAFGLAHISDADFTPFVAQKGSVLRATALLFTAYTGFNVITNMAGSVRKPQRTVPLAIVLSILISALVYMGVIVALLASGQHNFGDAGLGKAAKALMGDWGQYLIAFAACVSTISGANANLLGASDVMINLAAHGDVPPLAARTTSRGHPFLSVLFAGGMASVLIVSGGTDTIVSLSNVTAILAMLIVNAGAFRVAHAGWKTPGIRLPGGVLIPVLGFLTALAQLPSLGLGPVLVGTVLVLAGLVLYSQRHREVFAGDKALVLRLIRDLETPLARALRRRSRART